MGGCAASCARERQRERERARESKGPGSPFHVGFCLSFPCTIHCYCPVFLLIFCERQIMYESLYSLLLNYFYHSIIYCFSFNKVLKPFPRRGPSPEPRLEVVGGDRDPVQGRRVPPRLSPTPRPGPGGGGVSQMVVRESTASGADLAHVLPGFDPRHCMGCP